MAGGADSVPEGGWDVLTAANDSPRRRILFIPAWYPSLENPTAGTFVREHARAVSLYDDVTVLYVETVPLSGSRDRLSWHEEVDEGIPIVRVRVPHIRGSYTLAVMAAYQRLRWRGYRPDVIHAHVYLAGVPAVLIAKLHHLPVVVTEHFTGFPRRTLSKVRIRQAEIAFRWADTVMPVSRSLQQAIESYGIRASFKVVPNAVDTALFRPSSSQPKRSTKRLLFVGLLDPSHKKGVPHLLRALAQLRRRRNDWRLDIVGDGPARAEYERMALDLGIGDKIAFHGLKSKPEVGKLMHGADLFLLPSLVETFSAVAAEALATGTPVVATRCGGPEDFVTPEVGLLVPPGDAEALADAIGTMLDSYQHYDPEAVAAYAHGRFSHEAVGMQLHEIYRESVARRQHANSVD